MGESFFFRDALAKAQGGAGSRGGNVIGHTRSGKPIYAHSHTHYSGASSGKAPFAAQVHDRYAQSDNYTAQDHKDAAALHSHRSSQSHRMNVEGLSRESRGRLTNRHRGGHAASQAHRQAAAFAEDHG